MRLAAGWRKREGGKEGSKRGRKEGREGRQNGRGVTSLSSRETPTPSSPAWKAKAVYGERPYITGCLPFMKPTPLEASRSFPRWLARLPARLHSDYLTCGSRALVLTPLLPTTAPLPDLSFGRVACWSHQVCTSTTTLPPTLYVC